MKYADLHVHSSFSDGTLTPEELVMKAKRKGIKYIAITDHDSINAQYITKEKFEDIEVIPGIELSTDYYDLELHILGYFIDINNKELQSVVDRLNKGRVNRIEKILNKLEKNNVKIEIDEITLDPNSTIGRSHVANAMVKKGYFKTYKEAFTTYLMKGKPAYVKGDKLHYKETIEIINKAGGIAVLAHPGQIYRGMAIEQIIKELKYCGLRGIEVYHPSHTKDQIVNFYNLAIKHKLLITGGSDFHGKQSLHETGIGAFGINENLMNKIIKISSRRYK